ncbi:MAG: D-alanyl-D-alanine carboxypeptidase [Victivallaceae bacterium]|nr:D-alanyl-D-alanine carboxypeptidase [Victivallaceae bacterium]
MNEFTKTRLSILTVLAAGILFALLALLFLPGGAASGRGKSGRSADGVPEREALPEPVLAPGRGELDWSRAVRGDLSTLTIGAGAGILVDLSSGKVLWAKNPHQPRPLASMTKMMTMLVALEELERKPNIGFETPVPISQRAEKINEGEIWLSTREVFPLGDLMKAMMIRSANDAAWQVAEFVSGGDMDHFIALMNSKARYLGMRNTKFVNPNGLPDHKKGDSLSSPADLVLLVEQLLNYPAVMKWCGTQQDFVRGGKTELTNTNRLILPHYPGVDGMKTGFTRNAGFCLAATCIRENRRLVAVVMGFSQRRERDYCVRRLLDWGYRQTP